MSRNFGNLRGNGTAPPYGVAVGLEVAKAGLRTKPASNSLISQQACRVFSYSPCKSRGVEGLLVFPSASHYFYCYFFISIYVSSIEGKKERERERERESGRERERESYERERSYLVRLADRRRSYTKENRDRKRGEMDGGWR